MKNKLKVVNTRLKLGKTAYKGIYIKKRDDIGDFLNENIFTNMDEDLFGIIHTTSKGEIINVNIGNEEMFNNHLSDVLSLSALSNAASVFMFKTGDITSKANELFKTYKKAYDLMGIQMLDTVYESEYGVWDGADTSSDYDDVKNITPNQREKLSTPKNKDIVRIKLHTDKEFSSKNEITMEQAHKIITKELSSFDRECFCVLNLDSKNRPINCTFASLGDISSSIVSPREVFKSSLLCDAASVVVFHNHPSGDLTPSKTDIATTKRLIDVAYNLNIAVKDHQIIGEKKVYSMKRFDDAEFTENYENNVYKDNQMLQIKKGLEAGLDVSVYADPKYDWQQMYDMREKLKAEQSKQPKFSTEGYGPEKAAAGKSKEKSMDK